jgi:hypothetical protein
MKANLDPQITQITQISALEIDDARVDGEPSSQKRRSCLR